jgi:glycosyltransferase EpsE
MNNQPLVSVVMATYNEPEKFIKESIESILNQTYKNIELIISDDSTKEKTIHAIDLYSSDERVTIIRKTSRMGFVSAINEGLKKAKGTYIARMDGDDISDINRFQKQIDFFARNRMVDVLGSGINIIDEHGTVKSHRIYPTTHKQLYIWSIFRSPFAHPTVMFRKSIIECGLFYNQQFKKAEDIDFWLKVRNHGFKFMNMNEKLLNYRVVGQLGQKRNKTQWIYNFKARLKEFSWQYFFFSLLSITFSFLYILIPNGIINIIYSKENNKHT